MLRAKLVSTAALLAMGIFALTPSVQAQHHGGSGHGGGGHGGGHVSSGAHWSGGGAHWSGGHNAGHWSGGAVNHGGYYHGGYYGHYGYRPYYGYGYWPYYAFGLGSYLLPYANNYSNSYYSTPYYDSAPYYDTYSDQSSVTPSYTYPSAQPELVVPAALNQARLEVIVPDPNAEVWIQGARTTTTGTRRVYVSPALSSGASYTYTVKGAWSRNGGVVTEQRNVPVTAGTTAVVDFTRPAARAQ